MEQTRSTQSSKGCSGRVKGTITMQVTPQRELVQMFWEMCLPEKVGQGIMNVYLGRRVKYRRMTKTSLRVVFAHGPGRVTRVRGTGLPASLACLHKH
jgi:hypothetical protein